ncbi:LemA family protein [Xylophilus sp.]|uniref:LemA family protein n=1 Tax=Xylophilus sp. TaxID=2653893 RepID=UPI0013B60A61|nr:LemA family protein [Xylophilus sp.]KAF1042361.1 MAG: hypothetical protein GAK38_04342 [Xylophilus sp.]
MGDLLSSSLVLWAVAALTVFWAVGAYNRLMRLRSAALQAFGALDTYLLGLVSLLRECDAQAAVADHDPSDGCGAPLGAMAAQFGASLVAARAQPLRPASLAALAAARDTLRVAWEQTAEHRTKPQRRQWNLRATQVSQASLAFNDAVQHYNAAIAQFPALMLSWLFGFKPARPL